MLVLSAADGDHASVSDLADDVLELDGSVMDVELRCQDLLDVAQNAFTLRGRNVIDADMTGQRMSV